MEYQIILPWICIDLDLLTVAGHTYSLLHFARVFTVCTFESGSSTENLQPVAALSNSTYHVYDLGPYIFPKVSQMTSCIAGDN